MGIVGVFIIIFSALIISLCVKKCCKNNKSQLSFYNTLKKSKKPKTKTKDFTNLDANVENINNMPPMDSSIHIENSDINHQIESNKRSTISQEAQKPIVENEFQILRKQLMSNMRNSSDDYENVYNNMALKKAHKYKY